MAHALRGGRLLALSLLALLALACDDASPTPAGEGGADALPTADLGTGADLGGGAPDATIMPDASPPPAARPAFVELTLAPRQPLYTQAETPQAVPTVYDRLGREIPLDQVALRLDVQPAAMGAVDAAGVVTFAREGQGAVRACVVGTDLCGRAPFFVDDGAPSLVVTAPAPGTLIEGAPVIQVVGQADPGAAVFVNEVAVAVDAQGAFQTELPAVFGYNRVDVVADDGVRRPPARVVREALYAPVVLPATDTGVELPDALRVRIDQRLLDTGDAAPPPDEAGAVAVPDLAGLVEVFLARLELIGLVPNPLSDSASLSLRVVGVEPGEPDCTLLFTEDGLEIFLRLSDLTLRTEGFVEIEGERFDLGGAIRVTAAAVASVQVLAGPDGAPTLQILTADVALERLSGDMADSTAQALLDTFGSLVRTVLEGAARDLVDDVVQQAVPDFLALGLGDALDPLRAIPLDVEASPPLPAIAVDLGFELSAPVIEARSGLSLGLSGAVRQRVPVAAPYPVAGVPAESLDSEPPWPAAGGLALAVRLSTVNALAHAVWQQGALTLDLTEVVPEQLRALIREARVDARLPPLVVATPPGSPALFELQLGELDLYLRGARSGDTPDHYVLSVRAGLLLEVGEGGIRFNVAERADIRVALVDYSGARPAFEADLLAQILEPIVWGQVREAVGEGLSLALDPIVVGPDTYGAFAPSIQAIEVRPDFPAAPVVRRGWFVLPAGLSMVVR